MGMNVGYTLVDSEELAQKHTCGYRHCPPRLLGLVRRGWYLKVAVARERDGRYGERFWCVVREVRSDGLFLVTIQQDLVREGYHGLSDGISLEVRGKHVFGILTPQYSQVWDTVGAMASIVRYD